MRFNSREDALQFVTESDVVTEVCSAIVIYVPQSRDCLFTYRSGNELRFEALNEKTPYILLGLDYKSAMFQLPAGKMERDETPAQAMTREFNEEIFGFETEARLVFGDGHYTGSSVPAQRFPGDRGRLRRLVVHHFEYVFTDPLAYAGLVGAAKSLWMRRIVPGEGTKTCEFMDIVSVPITVERGKPFHFPELVRAAVRPSFRDEIIRCMRTAKDCLGGSSIMDAAAYEEFVSILNSSRRRKY